MNQFHSFFFQELSQIPQFIILVSCSGNSGIINLNATLCNYLFHFNKETFALNFLLILDLILLYNFHIILFLQALELTLHFLSVEVGFLFEVLQFLFIYFLLCLEASNFPFLIILLFQLSHYSIFKSKKKLNNKTIYL